MTSALRSVTWLSAAEGDIREVSVPEGACLLTVMSSDSKRSFAVCVDPNNTQGLAEIERALLSCQKSASAPVLKAVASGRRAQQCIEWLQSWLAARNCSLVSSAARADSPVQCQVHFSEQRLRVAKALSGGDTSPARRRTRVLIIDDSKTIHVLLRRILEKDPEIEVVGAVSDPLVAEKEIEKLKPDLITLDIHMPGLTGVELLARYIRRHPIPTLMISSVTKEEGPEVFNALELGAVDYLQKPTMADLAAQMPVIVERVKQAAKARVRAGNLKLVRPVAVDGMATDCLIALGASTGGTEALKEVLLGLPEKIPPILIVQHIPPVFSRSFAERLDALCPFEVKEAVDGDVVRPGQVLIAPGGFQMELDRGGERVRVTDAPPVNRHKPSVDHLFHSIGRAKGSRRVLAAILTGMGQDGADGLLALRKAGARTLAQDESTSVVYGMPKAAVALGAAESSHSLGQIASQLVALSRAKR